MASSGAVAQVLARWTSGQDELDSQLPDDEEFIANLLADDDEDCDQITVLDDAGGYFCDSMRMSSPASVMAFDYIQSNPKRIKLFDVDEVVSNPLPNPVKRPSWNRPVCTYLNYLGSRKVDPEPPMKVSSNPSIDPCIKHSAAPTSAPTLAPTPTILFPVCPCKLKHLCHAGNNAISPPILQLLAAANICKPIAPRSSPETVVDILDEEVDDMDECFDDEPGNESDHND
jgi:hypothetical protein